MNASSLHWRPVLVGGFLAETILIVAVIPMRMVNIPESALTMFALIGSFIVFVPVAWKLCRPLARPILHGVLMGAFAAAIYFRGRLPVALSSDPGFEAKDNIVLIWL